MNERDSSTPKPPPVHRSPHPRSYRKPRLTRLGTLTEVTQGTGTMGTIQDGHNSNKTA